MVVIHVAVRDEDGVDIRFEKLINSHARLQSSPKEEKIMRILTKNRVSEDFDAIHLEKQSCVSHKGDFS